MTTRARAFLTVSLAFLFLGLSAAASAQTAGSSTPIIGRIEGGIYRAAGFTGLVIGGGAAARPFSNPSLEVGGDIHLTRNGGINGIYASANVFYNVSLAQSKAMPFVGGGLGILHGGSPATTSSRPQILAGVEVPLRDRTKVRGEIRIVFTSGAVTTLILGGISF